MKGWRATGDWAKVPEDRVTVSKSVFSTGLAGEGPKLWEGPPREMQALGSEGPPPLGGSFWSPPCCFKGQGSNRFFLVFLRSPLLQEALPALPAFGGS